MKKACPNCEYITLYLYSTLCYCWCFFIYIYIYWCFCPYQKYHTNGNYLATKYRNSIPKYIQLIKLYIYKSTTQAIQHDGTKFVPVDKQVKFVSLKQTKYYLLGIEHCTRSKPTGSWCLGICRNNDDPLGIQCICWHGTEMYMIWDATLNLVKYCGLIYGCKYAAKVLLYLPPFNLHMSHFMLIKSFQKKMRGRHNLKKTLDDGIGKGLASLEIHQGILMYNYLKSIVVLTE